MGCHPHPSRIRLTATVLILLIWPALGGNAVAQPPSKTFVVVGTGPVQGGDQNAARTFAIEAAKLSAVELMTAELVALDTLSSRFQALDDLVFRTPDAFIEGYRVLEEIRGEREVRVLVQATVSARNLERKLRAEGFLADQAAAGTELEVTVQGTGDLPGFVQFRQSLSEMPGVEEIQMREIGTDAAVMAVRWQGSGDSFSDALVRQRFEDFAIRVYQTGASALRVELVR